MTGFVFSEVLVANFGAFRDSKEGMALDDATAKKLARIVERVGPGYGPESRKV
jgi:hypothetical protein